MPAMRIYFAGYTYNKRDKGQEVLFLVLISCTLQAKSASHFKFF
jgi:hypothetical protein